MPRGKVGQCLHRRVSGASAVSDNSRCLERVLAGLGSHSKLVVGGTAYLRFVKAKVNSSRRFPSGPPCGLWI